MTERDRGDEEAIERELDQALARLPKRAAPAALKARLAASVSPPPPRPRQLVSRRSLGFALSATALTGALLGLGWFRALHDPNALVAEAVNDHLRVLYAQQGIEIQSGGIHQVKPWFEGRLDFAPVLAFDGDDEFTLQGGSVAYYLDRKAATFVFKHRLHILTLFVFRADGLPWPMTHNQKLGRHDASFSRSRGFNTLLFRDGDLGYALVSDVDPQTLLRLGTKVAGHPGG
jgi:anti-sigma factor RsiW